MTWSEGWADLNGGEGEGWKCLKYNVWNSQWTNKNILKIC